MSQTSFSFTPRPGKFCLDLFGESFRQRVYVRPASLRPGELTGRSIAKLQFVRSRDVWKIFWKRADLKWHGYQPCPEVSTLDAALRVIDKDAYCCFFG